VVFAQAGITLLRWLAPSALPRRNEIRHRRGGAARHSWHLRCDQSAVWPRSRPEISCVQRRAVEGVRPREHDDPWATPHAEYARRGTNRACRCAVDGLRPDGSDVCHMRQVQPGFARPTEVETFELSLPAALVPMRSRWCRPTNRSPRVCSRSRVSPRSGSASSRWMGAQ
jgi:hypothetical protein